MLDTISQEEVIFQAALEIAAPEQRSAYLDNACAGHRELRRRVEALLRRYEESVGPLDRPVGGSVGNLDDSIAERPGTVIGPYKLLEEIGEGGFGVVFMAEQTKPIRRKVALKVLKPGMDTRQVVARFEAERQALALMDHANIARVFDGGETASGRPYFVMELVKGVPITEYCDQNSLPIRQRLELFVTICQAVQHAHQKGIIHRDLKPSNILIVSHDSVPVPKVIDFGIAKTMSGPLTDKTVFTGFAQMVGTPLYMSPEQAGQSSLDVDTRCDIYSLGVLLYELLTGTTPFDARALKTLGYDEIRRVIREDEPPRPSQRVSTLERSILSTVAEHHGVEPRRLGQQLRGELDWIVMKCLEKDRNRRYETATELAHDVEHYLRDEPVQAGPPSQRYRIRKFLRRNKGPVVAVSLFVVVLIVGVVSTSWGLMEAIAAQAAESEERIRAESAEEEAKIDREKARTAARNALESEADMRAFSEFLASDILAAPRPEGVQDGVDVNVTLAEALRKAESKITARFAGQPKAEAMARNALGVTWRTLGKYDEAERHLSQALELRERELGLEARETIACRNSLGVVLCSTRKNGPAIELLKMNLESARRVLGRDDPITLANMDNLAEAYHLAGQYDLAVNLREEALPLFQARLGPNHRDTLLCRDNLASAYRAAGKRDKARKMNEETVPLFEAGLGPTHPDTLASKSNLAMSYMDERDVERAVPLFEEVLKQQRVKLGNDHPDTVKSMCFLAWANSTARRHHLTMPLYQEAFEVQRTKLGPDHVDTLRTMASLGMTYRDAQRYREAIPILAELLERWGKQPRPFFHETATDALAQSYIAVGQPDRAEPLFRALAEEAQKRYGSEHATTAFRLSQLGIYLVGVNKFYESEAILREAVTIRQKNEPDGLMTFGYKAWLADALIGQKKFPEAERLIVQIYEAAKPLYDNNPSQNASSLTDALQHLVELYAAWGQVDKAAAWRRDLDALKKKQTSAKTPGVGAMDKNNLPR